MRVAVKDNGLLIPRKYLKGIREVEIKNEGASLVIRPVSRVDDPIFALGSEPGESCLGELSLKHDEFLYGQKKK